MKRMLIMTFLIFLVYTGISQDNKRNSISLGFGSVVSNKMDSFSPVIDLNYRRNLTDRLGLNVGYKFKDCSYDTIYELRSNETISKYTVQYKGVFESNSVYLGLTYNIEIANQLYIVPIFNIGVGYAIYDYTIPNQYIGDVVEYEDCNKFIYINPAVNIEYNVRLFKIFCSYSYDMPFIKNGFKSPFFDLEARTNRVFKTNYYFLGDLKLGVAFKF